MSPASLPAPQSEQITLAEARHARSLTQAQLAALLGRPQSFVSKYERGERRLDFVEVLEIADALQADIGDLAIGLRRRS